jgi:hypothetical protein
MRGIDIGAFRSAALGDVNLASRSSGAAGTGVSRLLLLGSPSFPPPPID